jgi:hypothetical protein
MLKYNIIITRSVGSTVHEAYTNKQRVEDVSMLGTGEII